MIDAAKYPQLAKMEQVQAESQAIGAFIEWLSENKMFIGTHVLPEGHVHEIAVPIAEGTEQLLARHFEVDLNAVERERRAVLAAHNTAMEAGR